MSHLFENPAESTIMKMPPPIAAISPSSPHWKRRVSIEIKNVMNYIDYLRSQSNPSLWFFLRPSSDKRYNFQKWDGELKIPSRPDIKFELRIVLTSEYPNVFPRAFAEKSIMDYCAGNIYPKNIWTEPGNPKEYIMICHDHMTEQEGAWNNTLTIAHFFIREVMYWWNSKLTRIIEEWDSKNYGVKPTR